MTAWLMINIPLWDVDDTDINKTADKIIKILEKEGFPDSTIEDIL